MSVGKSFVHEDWEQGKPEGWCGYVHYIGCVSDYTLCGLDQDGDDTIGLHGGTRTERRVDCPDCIQIIKHVRKVRARF